MSSAWLPFNIENTSRGTCRDQCFLRFNAGRTRTRGIARLLVTAALLIPAAIGGTAEITVGDVVFTLPAGWEVKTTSDEKVVQVMPSDSGGLLAVNLLKSLGTRDPEESLRVYWSQEQLKAREITPAKSEKTPLGKYIWGAAYATFGDAMEMYLSIGFATLDPSRWALLAIVADRPETLNRYQHGVLTLVRSARLSERSGASAAGRHSDESLTKQLIGRWKGIGFYEVQGLSATVGDLTFNSDGSFHQSYDYQGGYTQLIVFIEGRYSVRDSHLLLQPVEAHYTIDGVRKPYGVGLTSSRIVQLNLSEMKLEMLRVNRKKMVMVDYRKELED